MTKFLNNINLEAGNDIQFKTTAGANAGKIEQDGNNLVLSNAVGDVLLGDGSSDIYIGDGTNNVDILFEQSGSIKGDGSAVTLTLGGTNTTLNLENPNINGSLSIGATTINNKLTFTTANGYILFDYEPSGDTGEYTSEVPLIKVDHNGTEKTILSRISENGAIQLGHDDTVLITAGDVGDIMKTNWGATNEAVVLAAESGFYAYGFPDNTTTWANRNEFVFYSSSATAANNGLYIGDGGSTQFIDLSRNLKNIGTISSGAITSTSHIEAAQHFKATNNNISFHAGGTQVLNIDVNKNIYPSTDGDTDLGFSDSSLRFRNGYFTGELQSGSLDINGNADISGNLSGIDTLSAEQITIDGNSTNVPLYVRSTGTVSYLQIQNSSTGTSGTGDGFTIGANGTAAYLWQRENAVLYIGTNDTTAVTIDASQNATFAGTVTANGVTLTGDQDLSGYVTTSGDQTITGVKSFTGELHWDLDSGQYAGDPRAVVMGYSGGNYGQLGYNIDFTSTSGSHTRVFNDIPTRMDLYDGIQLYSSTAGLAETSITWGTALLRVQSNGFQYKGNNIYYVGNDSGILNSNVTLSSLGAQASGNYITGTGSLSAQDLTDIGNLSGTNTGDQDLSSLAPKASPTFTGTPVAPTASAGTETTQIATTAFVSTAISNLIGNAPENLNTLNELAEALNNDDDAVVTINTALAARLPLSGGTMSGAIAMGNNNITGVNSITFADPGPSEGLTWTNTRIFESPNDLTTNTAGNFQVVHTNTRRLTVDSSGIDVNGNIVVSGTVDGVDIATRDGVLTSTTTTANAALPKAGGTMTGDLILGDNVKLEIGSQSGGDLQLYHDGTHSWISDQGAGNLTVLASAFVVNNAADSENMIIASSDGSVNLYYDGSQKFRTVSAGVEVTGNLTLSGGSSIIDQGAIYIQDTAAGRLGWNRNTSNGAIHDSNYNAFQAQVNASGASGKFEIQAYNGAGSYGGSFFINGTAQPLINDYILHNGDEDTKIGFSGLDTFVVNTGGTTALTVDSDQNTTFTGDLKVFKTAPTISIEGDNITSANLKFKTNSVDRWNVNVPSGQTNLAFTTGSTDVLSLDTSNNATFAGSLTIPEYIYHSGDTSNYHRFLSNRQIFVVGNASSIDLNNGTSTFGYASGATTLQGSTISLDASADITIDAGGQDIILSDDGTIFGTISNSSGLQIRSRVDNADMFLRGVDNGTEFNALTLDMSDNGAAYFSSWIYTSGGGIGRDAHNVIDFSTDNQVTFKINNINQLVLNQSRLAPSTNDGSILGSASLGWSDLFLASGAVINFNNSDVTMTHSSNQLEVNGGNFVVQSNIECNDLDIGGTATGDGSGLTDLNGSQITTGTIASARLDADTAHLTTTQTFSGSKTFSAAVTISNATASTTKTTGALKVSGGIGVSGALNAGGDVVAYASSDKRYKDNLQPITNPIDKVKSLTGYTFTWNDKHEQFNGSDDIGVVAQEVEKVFPEIVDTRDNGYKAVKYEKMVAVLIEAVKDQQKQIDELKEKCNGCSC